MPGRFLGSAITIALACLGHSLCVLMGGGVPRPLPSPGIQLFLPRQEFRLLCTVHMATMGPILRTLENTAPAENGWILVRHKGPQCRSVDQGTNGGKEQHSCPLRLSSLEVAAPWDHSVQKLSKARTETQQGAKWGGKIPQHSLTSADLKPLRSDLLTQLLGQCALSLCIGSRELTASEDTQSSLLLEGDTEVLSICPWS